MTALVRFGVELRAEVRDGVLFGHAAVFGQTAVLPGHYEMLARSAFDDVLADDATDVRALLNHDPSLLLGRQGAGTLRVATDSTGLAFSVDLPDTSTGRDVRALLERGDLTGASFGFVPGEDSFSRAPDGKQIRTHTSVSALLDVSVVTFPAYGGASASLRHVQFGPPNRVRSQVIRARARALGRV